MNFFIFWVFLPGWTKIDFLRNISKKDSHQQLWVLASSQPRAISYIAFVNSYPLFPSLFFFFIFFFSLLFSLLFLPHFVQRKWPGIISDVGQL